MAVGGHNITIGDIVKSLMIKLVKQLYHYDHARQAYTIKASAAVVSAEEMEQLMDDAIERKANDGKG